MSKLANAFEQQQEEYIRRPPLHLRTSKSSTIRHNLLLSPTRTTSGSLRGGPTSNSRRRTNSLHTAAHLKKEKDLKLLPRLEEENANLPPQVSYEKDIQIYISLLTL